jgi:hypothetical protein
MTNGTNSKIEMQENDALGLTPIIQRVERSQAQRAKTSEWTQRQLDENELLVFKPFDNAIIQLRLESGECIELDAISMDNTKAVEGKGRTFISLVDAKFPKNSGLKYGAYSISIRNTINFEQR